MRLLAPAPMGFVDPWRAVEDGAALVDELRRELGDTHLLAGIPVQALARCTDRDEVLFELKDGTERVASVHLSWAAETGPDWPSTTLYRDLASWSRDRSRS